MDDTNQNVVPFMNLELKKNELDLEFWNKYQEELLEYYRGLPEEVRNAKVKVTYNMMLGLETSQELLSLASSCDEDAGEWDVGKPVGEEVLEYDSSSR
jgi:hypothetical protein